MRNNVKLLSWDTVNVSEESGTFENEDEFEARMVRMQFHPDQDIPGYHDNIDEKLCLRQQVRKLDMR